MIRNRQFRAAIFSLAFLLGSSTFVSIAARAQRTAGGIAMHPVATHRIAVRPVAPRTPARPAVSTVFFNPNASASIFQPGLLGFGAGQLIGFNGFNFDPIEGAIDPATQWRIAVAERFLRNTRGLGFGGGYYPLDGGGYYPIPEENSDNGQQPQQPQVIVVQGGPPSQQTPAAAPETAPEQAVPDAGQFTLILRNGTQIDAVAFTHLRDQIVYITADGTRHMLAASALDADATVRVNEERGTPLQLPL
jgi:hypothetical protein